MPLSAYLEDDLKEMVTAVMFGLCLGLQGCGVGLELEALSLTAAQRSLLVIVKLLRTVAGVKVIKRGKHWAPP